MLFSPDMLLDKLTASCDATRGELSGLQNAVETATTNLVTLEESRNTE